MLLRNKLRSIIFKYFQYVSNEIISVKNLWKYYNVKPIKNSFICTMLFIQTTQSNAAFWLMHFTTTHHLCINNDCSADRCQILYHHLSVYFNQNVIKQNSYFYKPLWLCLTLPLFAHNLNCKPYNYFHVLKPKTIKVKLIKITKYILITHKLQQIALCTITLLV